jgi:hypothetical protein
MLNTIYSAPVNPGETVTVRVSFRVPYRRVDYVVFGPTRCRLEAFGAPTVCAADYKLERDAKSLLLLESECVIFERQFKVRGSELLLRFANQSGELAWTPNVVLCADDEEGRSEG